MSIPQTQARTSPGGSASPDSTAAEYEAASGRPSSWWPAAVFLGIPCLVLALAYAWLAIANGQLLLWNVVVHESGRYTLGQTILYFGHFLREIPTDLALALFLLAAFLDVRSAHSGFEREKQPKSTLLLSSITVALALALVLYAWFWSVAAHGSSSALRDLLQYRTRDELEAYGSHWHFHWLSTLWFGCASQVVVQVAARHFGWTRTTARNRVSLITWVAWGYFAGLTAVFGLSPAILLDPRYIGHQAREIMTHGPVTLLFTIGLFHLIARQRSDLPAARTQRHQSGSAFWLCASLSILIPLFLAARTIMSPVMASGQVESGLAAMVAAHFFEHVLDYGLVALLGVAGLAGVYAVRGRGRYNQDLPSIYSRSV